MSENQPDEPKSTAESTLDKAAEIAGRSLGQLAGAVDSIIADHPDPVGEVRDAISAGREQLGKLASRAKTQSKVVARKAKAVVKKARAAATRARRQSGKSRAKATPKARKAGTRAKGRTRAKTAAGRRKTSRGARRRARR
jgi:hypothetical protein